VNSITAQSCALVHLSILLPDGSAADSTRVNGEPTLFILGEDSLSPKIEDNLIGKVAGDKVKLELSSDDAFGPANPDLVQFFDIKDFPNDIELEPGVIIGFTQPSGQEMPGVVTELAGTSVKVDFNHPLAGKDVIFDIEIVEVDPKK
jgi:FKBP-type peptidyl-prolyl cis-trans isomerase SlpA